MVIDTAYQHLQLKVPKLFKLDIIIFILQASKWGENKTQSLIKNWKYWYSIRGQDFSKFSLFKQNTAIPDAYETLCPF